MKKRISYTLLGAFLLSLNILGQSTSTDSLKIRLLTAKEDTGKVELLLSLSRSFYMNQPKASIEYADEAIKLSEKLGYKKGLSYAYKNIGMAYYFQGDYLKTITYWQQSLAIFEEMGDKLGISNLLSNLGAVNSNEGDDAKAIEMYLESLKIAEELDDTLRTVTALINIGLVYLKNLKTHDQALEYYQRALPLCEKIKDNDAIGTASMNLGEIYLEKKDYSTALTYFKKSLAALESSGNIFYPLNNIGKVYAKTGEFNQALKFQQEAYTRAKKVDAKLDMSRALLGLADTYILMGQFNNAVKVLNESKSIAAEIGSNYELRDSYDGLAQSYAKISDYQNAFKYQSLLTDIKDTLFNTANEKRIGLIVLNYENEKKQDEINLLTKDKLLQDLKLKRQRMVKNTFLGGLIVAFVIAFIIFRNYKQKVKTNKLLDKQKAQIESLLLNILPQKIADELQFYGTAIPRSYECVTVLFSDFKDFTKISAQLTPDELVAELNDYFIAFDNISEKYNLEKIKTIGDAYMCAGGLPTINDTHPFDIINAAFEMLEFMEKKKKARQINSLPWELRIGIHTGPIMAGVVGRKKYAYDIWGSTVNVASRMESNSEPGKINLSEATYSLVKDYYRFHYRGKIMAKNVGEIDMYFVEKKANTAANKAIKYENESSQKIKTG